MKLPGGMSHEHASHAHMKQAISIRWLCISRWFDTQNVISEKANECISQLQISDVQTWSSLYNGCDPHSCRTLEMVLIKLMSVYHNSKYQMCKHEAPCWNVPATCQSCSYKTSHLCPMAVHFTMIWHSKCDWFKRKLMSVYHTSTPYVEPSYWNVIWHKPWQWTIWFKQ